MDLYIERLFVRRNASVSKKSDIKNSQALNKKLS